MAFQNRSAYGDIYTIPTSAVDGIANRIYQEQKIREQQKLQQDKALDDEFAKNVAGVKSADIPDITSAYNEFKQAHINLQKKGNKATPQDQMDVMLKKANAFQAINASKEDKERIKSRLSEIKADKKGIYNPDAHTTLSEMLNTPTLKRKLDEDDDRLKYKYAMPNIDKEILNASGKGQEVPIEVGIDPNDPLKNKKEIYKTINPPNTFYNNLFTGLATRSDNKGFTRTVMDSLTDEEKEKLRIAYEAKIQDPKFKQLYGTVEPFPASAANTELGQAVALKTMEAFVNLPIDKPIRTQSVNDTEAVMDKRRKEGMEDWRTKNALTYQQSLAKIRLNNQNRKDGLPTEETGYLSDEVADEVGENQTVELGGKQREVKVIYTDKVDPKRLSIITAKGQVKPIPIKQTDGSVRMGYYQDRVTGDWEGLDGKGNRMTASRERVKDDYIKEAAPTKFKNQTGTKASENTKGQSAALKKVTTGFSREDLLNSGQGWTNERIDKAVKEGKIKLN